MEIYLFNWTNSNEFGKWGKKPNFEQVGPYVYAERNTRANVVFNEDQSVNFNTIRSWRFVPEKSKGSTDDLITIMNPVILAMANAVKKEHFLIKRGVHFFLKEFDMGLEETKSVKELLFDGVDDILMDLAEKLKIKKFKIPFDKFGFFYARNESVYYDGNYTIWTGQDDIQKTGIVKEWNNSNVSEVYKGECSRIDGSTGEVWYPVKDSKTISIFFSDVCGLLTLERQGSRESNGIGGNLYVATDRLFDNGSKYPEMACFSPNGPLPSGVRDISDCKYKAPAFVSLPHFYMADESYRKDVTGMKPDPEKHKIEIVIEPKYGLPIEAHISFQANLKLYQVKEIDLFKNVKDMMIPFMWVKVSVVIPDEYAFLVKIALSAVAIGQWIGYVFILISILLFLLSIYLELRKRDISVVQQFRKIGR